MLHTTLLQTRSTNDWSEIAIWSGVLMAAVIVGMLLVLWVKRKFASADDQVAEDFTLHGLRKMRDSGQMTEEEFERAKDAMIARVKRKPEGVDEDPAVVAVRELKRHSDKNQTSNPNNLSTDNPESPPQTDENPGSA